MHMQTALIAKITRCTVIKYIHQQHSRYVLARRLDWEKEHI